MEIENKLDYKFYKKKNKSSMIMYSIFSVLMLVQTIRYILDKEYLLSMIWTMVTIAYIAIDISVIKQQKNILIEPGLSVDEELIKFRANTNIKYKCINVKEINNLEVPKYDDFITIITANKKYIVLLGEYDQEIRLEIRNVFTQLSKKLEYKNNI